MNTSPYIADPVSGDLTDIRFEDLFNLDEIQQLQDIFANATRVASIITHPDGTPITKPSNFCTLCNDIIRKTPKGLANCYQSDAALGSQNSSGPIVQPCLSGGLWDAGASITVGGKHIANWLIGQVRNEELDNERMIKYADEIEADRKTFMEALEKVPVMSSEQFRKVSDMLFAFANELSDKAYNNLLLKLKIEEEELAYKLLQENEEKLAITLHSISDAVISTDNNGLVVSMNPIAEELCGWNFIDAAGLHVSKVFNIVNSKTREKVENPVDLVLENGKTVELGNHTILISRTGKEYHIADGAAPIKNKDDLISGVVFIFSDVTEKYLAEEKLKENEEVFRCLYMNMNDGVTLHELIYDDNGKPEDYTIIDTNPAFETQFGQPRDTIVGKTGRKVYNVFGINDPPLLDIYAKVALTKEPAVVETYFSPLSRYCSIMVYSPYKDRYATIFTDISERRKMEENLKYSEEKYHSLIESTPDWIWEVNAEGRYTYSSKAVRNILGYEPDDILGKSPFDLMPPEEAQRVGKMFADIVKKRKPIASMENLNIHRDGRLIILETNGNPIIGKDGELLGYRGTDRNITERKQAEDALRKSEEKYRLLVDHSQDIIFTVNPKGIYTFVSAAWETLLGHPASDVIGKGFYEFIHPDDVPKCSELLQSFLKTGELQKNIEYQIKNINGTWRWHVTSIVPLKDEKGTVTGLYGIARDTTEQKFAKTALKETEERYRLIIEKANEVIVVIQDGLFKFVNPEIIKLLGYTEKELISKPFSEFIHPNDLKIVEDNYQKRVIGEKKDFRTTFRILKKNKDFVWLDTGGVDFEWEGKPAIMYFASDITNRVCAEQEIKNKNEELQKINAEKDKFFSIIAHDLRSPFSAFLGYTELMASELFNMKLKDVQEIAVEMRKSANILYNLLENLLTWSRIQRGVTGFEPKLFTLPPKVMESMQPALDQAQKKNIEVSMNVPELVVFADENMLESTIRNISSNAVKYTHKGGKVSLTVQPTKDNFIEFIFRDTGIGMSKSIMEKLFHLDERASRQGTEGEPSTGLGLILCKDFIDKHGGQIWAESEEGKGSTFHFTIPSDKASKITEIHTNERLKK